MIEANRSYWESELYDQVYDLIVVGAGLTGQSMAYFYKKEHPDHNVLVIDRGFYPIGASTRNAGFACFGSVTEHIADMDIEETPMIIDRIRRRIEGLNLLRSTLGDDNIDYKEPGAYEIFTEPSVYEKSLEYLDTVNDWLVEAANMKEVYQPAKVNGYNAIRIKGEGCLHPGKMIRTLYEKNIRAGIEFRWEAEVKQLDTEEGKIILHGDRVLKSKQVAIATNSFSSALLPGIDIKPGRGFVFVTKPIRDLKWKGTFHYDRGYYYFRSVGEDRLLLGGARCLDIDGETTDRFGTNEKIKNHLISFADDVLKLPKEWEIDQEWSGIMGFTQSKSPVLKRISPSTLVVAGLSGMGVALGMQLGKEASVVLTNKDQDDG